MSSLASELNLPEQTHRGWAQKVIRGNYQPHIDGLRSIAVLPVLLYHLRMGLCPAGFMGVDVFFVISGYLICGGIMRDLQAGSFSMRSFYFRRIRRIFAAYFAVVTAGEYFGEIAPLFGMPRSATARARTDVTLVGYSTRDFRERVNTADRLLQVAVPVDGIHRQVKVRIDNEHRRTCKLSLTTETRRHGEGLRSRNRSNRRRAEEWQSEGRDDSTSLPCFHGLFLVHPFSSPLRVSPPGR